MRQSMLKRGSARRKVLARDSAAAAILPDAPSQAIAPHGKRRRKRFLTPFSSPTGRLQRRAGAITIPAGQNGLRKNSGEFGMTSKVEKLARRLIAPAVHRLFFTDLIRKTNNFGATKWLGTPVWQNVLDLWVIQETIAEVRPELLIECGTNRGGSSLFFAQLFDLMQHGSVITIDIEKLHNLTHPRVAYLIGISTSQEILDAVRQRVAVCKGPIMVILDSDHAQQHVRRELECYAPLVTRGSYCLVQDGVIDVPEDFSCLASGSASRNRIFSPLQPRF